MRIITAKFFHNGGFKKEVYSAMDEEKKAELVNLNTASLEERTEKLGHRAAAGVYEYRRIFGGFRDVEELQRARGVGVKTYEKLKHKVCV